MKKLSKLQESIWSDIQDRNSGEIVKKEDYGKDIVIDGEKYYLSKEFWTLGEEYEEENSDEWLFFAFNKPEDGSNKIIGNTDDIGVFGLNGYDTDAAEYDVYVLRDYLEHTKEELIENIMEEGQFNLIVYPEVKNICKDYITKLYESHMSDYANYWVNQVSTSDWGSDSTGLHIEMDTDFIPEYVEDEFENNKIEMAHIFCFPLLDNWFEGFEQDLIKAYEKLGWVKSEEYDIDPFDGSPGNMTALCFVQLNK